jgi:hypothetical protein
MGVEGELERKGETSPTLQSFLDGWPANETLELPPHLMLIANSWIDFYRDSGEHKQVNRGEIETYIMARHLIDQGQEPLIISDDTLAKDLCDGKECGKTANPLPSTPAIVSRLDTPTIVLHMVCEGVLSKVDGEKVWSACFSNRGAWNGYEPRLKSMCGK